MSSKLKLKEVRPPMVQQIELKSTETKPSLNLEGFWEQDVWDMNHSPLSKFWRSKEVVKLSFDMNNQALKRELKWVFHRQFINKDWSPGNSGLRRDLKELTTWLNERNFTCGSFLDYPLEKWMSEFE